MQIRRYLGIIFLCFIAVFAQRCSKPLDLGDEIPAEVIENQKATYSMTNASNMAKVYSIENERISFNIQVDDSYIVTYISTNDPDFRTPEGVYLGMTYEQVMGKTSAELKAMRGWGYYLKLPSGWKAVFFIGQSGTDSEPGEESDVTLLFKN